MKIKFQSKLLSILLVLVLVLALIPMSALTAFADSNNILSSASIEIPIPNAGDTSTAGIFFNSSEFNASIGWSTTQDGSEFNDFNNKTFEAGKTYYADIYLTANGDYEFADNTQITVNGQAYDAVWTVGSSYKEYVSVYDIPFTVPSTETYTVSFNANGGTGTMLDETEQLGGLILPNCTFTAPMGKQFKCWVEGGTGGDQYAAGEEYNVTENVTFYAIWEDIPASEYDVIYKPGDGEGIGDTETVANGTEYTLKAYNNVGIDACDGMTFNYWSIRIGDEESAEIARKQPGEKITVTENTYVVAIWKAAPDHTVTATAGENGLISPSGEVTVAHGANQAFTITANSGYRIKDVKVNGTSVGAVATYIFDDVTENATITVEFEVDTVPHVCNPTLVPKDEPECTTAGKNAYYHCECGKNYEDAQGNTEIANIETWGILSPLDHNPSATWSTDGEYHWKECTRCSGQQLEKAAHSGGTATCTAKANCSVCNAAYGNTADHNHGSEWQKNADEHWNECACGDKANKAAHEDSDSNGACDVCGQTMSVAHTHDYGTTWKTDANNHWKECECGDVSENAAHIDDNGDNKCDTCDYAMPAHDPDNPDTPPVDNPPSDDEGGLGAGAIIGIVCGSVAALGIGGFALFWFVIKKKSFADLIAVFKK